MSDTAGIVVDRGLLLQSERRLVGEEALYKYAVRVHA
jgi:hypothetical protein